MGFLEEQDALYDRVEREQVRKVDIDPDGTFLDNWLAVVVRHPTGIVYSQQCAGVATQHRLVEGYLVILGATSVDFDHPPLKTESLRTVFHDGDACMWPWIGDQVPEERIAELARLVSRISFWASEPITSEGYLMPLALDLSRRDEIAEAWIPVVTPDGPGVLLYENCD